MPSINIAPPRRKQISAGSASITDDEERLYSAAIVDSEAPDCEHCPGVLSISTAIDSGYCIEQCADCRDALCTYSLPVRICVALRKTYAMRHLATAVLSGLVRLCTLFDALNRHRRSA